LPYIVGDFLDDLERELVASRRDLAQRVDRVEALAALRSIALSVSSDLQRAITAEDVFSSGRNEQERAKLQSLAERITNQARGQTGLIEETGTVKGSGRAPALEGDAVAYQPRKER
jgi:hypothetical protein